MVSVFLVAQGHLVELYFVFKLPDALLKKKLFFIIFVAVSFKVQFEGGNRVFQFFDLLCKLFAEIFFLVEFAVEFRDEAFVVEDFVLFLIVDVVEFLFDVLDFPVELNLSELVFVAGLFGQLFEGVDLPFELFVVFYQFEKGGFGVSDGVAELGQNA